MQLFYAKYYLSILSFNKMFLYIVLCQNCVNQLEANRIQSSPNNYVKVTFTTHNALKCPICRINGFTVKIFK